MASPSPSASLFASLLTGGGKTKGSGGNHATRFDRKRFASDVALFEHKTPKPASGSDNDAHAAAAPPSEPPPPTSLDTPEAALLYRKAKRIRVDVDAGAVIPPPAPDLASIDAHMNARVVTALRVGSFANATACQSQCYTLMAAGFDVLCCAPTGSGKTLAFLAPVLSSFVQRREKDSTPCTHAVVLAPSRELAAQTARVLKSLAAGASVKVRVDTGVKDDEKRANASKAVPDFVVCTPDACASRLRKLGKVRALVLDEADRLLLDDGIRAHVQTIVAACTSKHLRMHMFSATIPEKVDAMAREMFRHPARVYVGVRNTPVSHVRQQLVYCGHGGQETGKMIAVKSVLRGKLEDLGGSFGGEDDTTDDRGVRSRRVFPCLIFCRSVARCQALFEQVRALFASLQSGDSAAAARRVVGLHGGMSTSARQDALTRFRSGDAWVLVATDVLSRGVDFAGVRLVVNYDFPSTAADYVHRVGRAGRAPTAAASASAQAPLARAVTLYTADDADALRPCAALIREAGGGAFLPDWLDGGTSASGGGDRKRRRGGGWRVEKDPGANAISGRREVRRRKPKE